MNTAQHTPGAMRAAEAIQQMIRGSVNYSGATRQQKVEMIATIIDREAITPELFAIRNAIQARRR